jgi:hypothetical protein
VDGKDKHVFGRFTTGTLVNPKEHSSFIIMEGEHVFGRFTTGTLVNPKEHASFIIMEGGYTAPIP